MSNTIKVPKMLVDAIDSPAGGQKLTQREIAQAVGYKTPNMLSMMKNGIALIPLKGILSLCDELGLDKSQFVYEVLKVQRPEIFDLLNGAFGPNWHKPAQDDYDEKFSPSAHHSRNF